MGKREQQQQAQGGAAFPTGVSVRQGRIQISFQYRGRQCREMWGGEATEPNLRAAARKREAVLYDIEHNSFDYAVHFPESKAAKRFGGAARQPLTKFKVLLEELLVLKEKALETSSSDGYRRHAKAQLFPKWGEVYVQEITPAALRKWLTEMPYTLKYVRNVLSVMRMVFDNAIIDGYIAKNPLREVKAKEWVPRKTAYSDTDLIDPFTIEEMRAILAACSGMERCMYRFGFATGMRTSELFALRWKNIDFVRGVAWVRNAFVKGEIKKTKTLAGMRPVQLLEDAKAALAEQKAYSFLRPDGVVWLHPRSGEPWIDDHSLRERFKLTLKRAGVRYRYPYQMRHTFVSHMLTNGENPKWVARQIGHKDLTTLFKHYDKWINTDGEGAYVPKTRSITDLTPGEAIHVERAEQGKTLDNAANDSAHFQHKGGKLPGKPRQ